MREVDRAEVLLGEFAHLAEQRGGKAGLVRIGRGQFDQRREAFLELGMTCVDEPGHAPEVQPATERNHQHEHGRQKREQQRAGGHRIADAIIEDDDARIDDHHRRNRQEPHDADDGKSANEIQSPHAGDRTFQKLADAKRYRHHMRPLRLRRIQTSMSATAMTMKPSG